MKPMKIFLRYWFAITSVLSFVAGWVVLAHSPKPVSSTSTSSSGLAPLPTLAPLNLNGTANSNNNNGGILGGLFSSGSSNNSQPGFGFSMRTGGS